MEMKKPVLQLLLLVQETFKVSVTLLMKISCYRILLGRNVDFAIGKMFIIESNNDKFHTMIAYIEIMLSQFHMFP